MSEWAPRRYGWPRAQKVSGEEVDCTRRSATIPASPLGGVVGPSPLPRSRWVDSADLCACARRPALRACSWSAPSGRAKLGGLCAGSPAPGGLRKTGSATICVLELDATARATVPVRKGSSCGPVRKPRGPAVRRARVRGSVPHGRRGATTNACGGWPHPGAPYYGSRDVLARPLGERDRGALESAW